jgi:hypothetical protein
MDEPRLLNLDAGKPHPPTALDAIWWVAQRLRIIYATLNHAVYPSNQPRQTLRQLLHLANLYLSGVLQVFFDGGQQRFQSIFVTWMRSRRSRGKGFRPSLYMDEVTMQNVIVAAH